MKKWRRKREGYEGGRGRDDKEEEVGEIRRGIKGRRKRMGQRGRRKGNS